MEGEPGDEREHQGAIGFFLTGIGVVLSHHDGTEPPGSIWIPQAVEGKPMHGWENLTDTDRDTILQGIEEGRALGGPYHVEIDPMDTCNVNCFFCITAQLHQGDVLRWQRLGPLVEEMIAGGLRSFRLAGGGEPLIYPDLDELCTRMAESGVVLDDVTTNGVRLDKAMDSILKPRLTRILVSLNYVNASQYGKFMRTASDKFDLVVRNIQRLHERLVELGRRSETRMDVHFFLHRSTVEDIPALPEISKSLPVDAVTIRAIGAIPREEVIPTSEYDRIRKLLPKTVDGFHDGPWLELDLNMIGMQDFAVQQIARLRKWDRDAVAPSHPIEYCYIPWYSMTVQGNGDVHPCCFLMGDDSVPTLGNVASHSIQEVWHGPMYRRFRREMRTVMLMEEKIPFQQRRFQCTTPACWKHDACPLAFMMADRDFYEKAHERLEILRRRPLIQVARMANHASRRMIDWTRSKITH